METVIRVAFLYFFIVIGLRVLGKREFSQLSSTDLVMLVIVSELVQQALIRDDFSAINAVIAVSTLFLLTFLNSTLQHWSKKYSGFISGQPAVLVYQGRFVPETMNRERIPPDDLYSEMHTVGLTDISQIEWALIEPDGKLSFIPFRQEDRLVRRDSMQHSK